MSEMSIDKKNIPVVIFCGGRGTRLKEETEIIPKPLIKVGEHPILWHIMKIYFFYGYRHFILPVGYKGEKIKEYFLNYAALRGDFTVDFTEGESRLKIHRSIPERWKVTIVDTGLDTEAGGRLKRIESHIENNLFMLTYGDGVANVNLDALVSFHKARDKVATVTAVHPPARFGTITMQNTLATSFMEKVQVQDGYINGGFFVFNRNIFKFIENGDNENFEKNTLPRLAQASELAVFCHNGYWQCMDTLRDTEFLNKEWIKDRAAWRVWET